MKRFDRSRSQVSEVCEYQSLLRIQDRDATSAVPNAIRRRPMRDGRQVSLANPSPCDSARNCDCAKS